MKTGAVQYCVSYAIIHPVDNFIGIDVLLGLVCRMQ